MFMDEENYIIPQTNTVVCTSYLHNVMYTLHVHAWLCMQESCAVHAVPTYLHADQCLMSIPVSTS